MNETQINQQEEKIEIKDNSQRGKLLIMIFGILTGVTLVGLLPDYLELQLLKRVQIGELVSEEEAEVSDLIQGMMGIGQFGLYITSVVIFLRWFRRAYGNLHRLDKTRLKHKESMAVWSWAIPIISLYRPVQIMNEIWVETQNQIKKFDSSYIIKRGGLIITLWWTLFVLSNFVGRYVLKTVFKQDTIEQVIERSKATLISDIMQVPEALLVILIVYKLSKMESRLAYEIKKAGGNVVSTKL